MRREAGPPGAEERGHLFEGWVLSVLRAYRDYRGLFDDWAYWAPGKVEVDVLLRTGRDLVAIEVKSTKVVRDADLRGLRAVADLPRVRRRLVVFLGERPQATADGIEVLPVRRFLREVEDGTSFP